MVESLPRKRLIGKCIYCLGTETLSDEHAIPSGMRGGVILKFATCEDCRLIIQPMEDFVLSIMLGPVRHAWGIAAKPNPKTLLALNVHVANGLDYKAKVPVGDLPRHSFGFPHLEGLPRILAPESAWSDKVMLAAQVGQPDIDLQMRKYGGTFSQQIRPDYFVRVLAKMAHCVLVAHLGLDGWEPTLTNAIREGHGEDRLSRTFFGTAVTLSRIAARHDPGRCPVNAEIGIVRGLDGTEYWAVNLHLLPDIGTPKHGFVVGKRLRTTVDLLSSPRETDQ